MVLVLVFNCVWGLVLVGAGFLLSLVLGVCYFG